MIIIYYIIALMQRRSDDAMKILTAGLKPIYRQIAAGIEDDILNEVLKPYEQAYSQYQMAREFGINPATASKGLNLLLEAGILFKKRGIGMFVTEEAAGIIKERRKEEFFSTVLREMLLEADKLKISKKEIIDKINMAKE